jgi:hypothetical protein
MQYDPSGTLMWAHEFGAIGWDDAYKIAVDAADNICRVVFGGELMGPVDFGLGPLSAGAGIQNGFLAEYSHDGAPLWTVPLGVVGSAAVLDVMIDPQEVLWATGGITGTSDLGGGPITSRGGDDVWVARFDP